MTPAESQRARYQARRDAGRCVRCNGGGDADTMIGVFCRECYDARASYEPSPEAAEKRRATARARFAQRYAEPGFRGAQIARMSSRYADRKARGICTLCGRVRAADGSNLCPPHLESERVRNRDAARRRRAALRAA